MGIILINKNMGEFLRESAGKYAFNRAIRQGGKSYTYFELNEKTDALAGKLISLGIKKGEHVGMLSDTSLEDILMKFALTRIGAVACLLNPALGKKELTDIMDYSDINTLIVGPAYKGEANFDGRKIYDIKLSESVLPATKEEVLLRESQVDPQDTALILYTSGTTGPVKAVMGSHYSRVNNGRKQAEDLGATANDVFLCALPTFHCFSLAVNIMAAFSVGATLVIPHSRHTADLLAAIQQEHCTVFSAVPTLFNAIISRPDFSSWNVSSVRVGVIGGSYCSPESFMEIEKAFGMTLLSSLGQTEATGGYTVSNLDDSIEVRANTLGHFMEFVEGKIADVNTGEALPPGQIGEICVKGYPVMLAYYKMEEATAKTLDKDGWLHTGDLGSLDDKGYLTLQGRIKEMIIRSGENIAPIEIESIFANDKRIEMIKAVGVPDNHYGEEICLCIKLSEGTKYFDTDEIRGAVRARLAAYKVPKYVLILDEFPCNATGKIKFNELSKLAAEKLMLE